MSDSNASGLTLDTPDIMPPDHRTDLRTTIEWTFQVRLPAEQFARATTAGPLADLVAARLERAYETDDETTANSLSARVTQRLRAAMDDLFDIPPGLASPAAQMHVLLQDCRIRYAWPELAAAADLRLPELEFAPDVARKKNARAKASAIGLLLTLALAMAAAIVDRFNGHEDLVSAMGSFACVGFLVTVVQFGLCILGKRDHVPDCCRTLADTALTAIRLNPIRLGPGRLSHEEVWQITRWTIAEELGVPPNEVTRDVPLPPPPPQAGPSGLPDHTE